MSEIRLAVTTHPHGSTPSTRQWIAGFAAFVLALAACVCAAWGSWRGSSAWLRHRAVLIRPHPVDLIVLLFIAGWLVVGPAHVDDGWILSEARAYDDVGSATSYYWSVSSNLPVGYWHVWLMWLWDLPFHSALWMRLLPAGILLIAWFVSRLCVALTIPMGARRPSTLALLAAAFCLGSGAWLVTLRHEPFVALLGAVVLAMAVMFARHPTTPPLIVGGLAIALAVSVHPAGIVAAAPAIAVLPLVRRWIQGSAARWAALIAVLLGVAAVTVVLIMIDSDLTLKMQSIRAFEEGAFHSTVALGSEVERYRLLNEPWYGPVMRRMSVGFIAIAVLAGLMSHSWRSVRRIPFTSLVLGLPLLALSPSKWPWHFGTLGVFVALTLVVEFSDERRWSGSPGRVRWLFLMVSMVTLTSLSWTVSQHWNPGDLVTLSWPGGLVPGVISMLAVLLVGLASLLAYANGRSSEGLRALVAKAVLVASVVVVVGVTVGTLIADAVLTPGWTFVKQNLTTAVGGQGCGPTLDVDMDAEAVVAVHPTLAFYFACRDQPSIAGGVAEWPDVYLRPDLVDPDPTIFGPITRVERYSRIPPGSIVYVSESLLSGEPRSSGGILTSEPAP